jgi:hypothetical protein
MMIVPNGFMIPTLSSGDSSRPEQSMQCIAFVLEEWSDFHSCCPERNVEVSTGS